MKMIFSGLFVSCILLLPSQSSGAYQVRGRNEHHHLQELAPIGQTAVDNGFSILADLLTTASLLDAVNDVNANLTVFAPTNDAFNALGQETLNSLLADIPTLTNVLLYHVVNGKTTSLDIAAVAASTPTFSVETLLGENATLEITFAEGSVTVQGQENTDPAMVTMADVMASNGVIHVIDKVLLPNQGEGDDAGDDSGPDLSMIGETAVEAGFSILVSLLNLTGLLDAVNDESTLLTVFAPTDQAFNALGEETLQSLLNDIPTLTNILLYHVLAGEILSSDIATAAAADEEHATFRVPTLLDFQTLQVTFNATAGSVSILGGGNTNQSNVVTADVRASNGVIHVIDQVLLPPTAEDCTCLCDWPEFFQFLFCSLFYGW